MSEIGLARHQCAFRSIFIPIHIPQPILEAMIFSDEIVCNAQTREDVSLAASMKG